MLMVFGSINADLSVHVPHLPRPGETLLGDSLRISPGGKGANQAHAAQRFGVATQLAGAVGDDAFAAPALAGLRAAGVDLQQVQQLKAQATGVACISVAADGENSIVVAPGANARLQAGWVADTALAGCRALLLQMEVPPAQSFALARRMRQHGGLVLLNAAPWIGAALQPGQLDWLIVNTVELQAACVQIGVGVGAGVGVAGHQVLQQARALAAALACRLLLTQGADGASIIGSTAGADLHQPALRGVRIVDTTGAGDTCAGVFGAALCEGQPEAQALALAVAAAGLACEGDGAQAPQPDRAAIQAALARLPAASLVAAS